MGGETAVKEFIKKRYGNILGLDLDDRQSEIDRDEGRQKKTNQQAIKVKSHVTNVERSTMSPNGMIQPFDQVMSNFGMYGLANRGQLDGRVDNSAESQTHMM